MAHDLYEMNLEGLLNNLTYQTPETGFGQGYKGQDPDKAYGLALYVGDTTPTDCKSCVTNATFLVHSFCLTSKRAVMWYKFCMLKYNDKNFFGQIDNHNRFQITDSKSASDPTLYNQMIGNLLSELVRTAFVVPMMYANNTMKVGEIENLICLLSVPETF